MDIFEKINELLLEATNKSKIPVHPEMETKEQGEMAAAEKILKLFQRLKMGGSGGEQSVNNGKPEIPDDIIDPKFKTPPSKSKDKEFHKNKLSDWDERSDDKIQKEIETEDNQNDEKDPFDDFDYKDNDFGDDVEDDDDDLQDQNDGLSEDEKLKNNIEDAIDKLNNEKQGGEQGGKQDDDSGANWDDDDDNIKDGEGMPGEQTSSGGNDNKQSTKTPKQQSMSAKKQKLEDLKKSLESKDMKEISKTIDDIKNISDIPDSNKDNIPPGGKMESPTDKDVEEEMDKAGMDTKSIKKVLKEKNTDTSKDYTDEELEKLQKQVSDELNKICKAKGGSALADSITTAAMGRKIKDDDWKKILKLFLNKRSIHRGNTSTRNDEISFGNKHSLWRGAVLPKFGEPSKGAIQSINCFVDFSGSVNEDLVYDFLGEVINLCVDLKYTNVNVYGFSDELSLPKTINCDELMDGVKTLEDGIRRSISETWDYIKTQIHSSGDNFKAVSEQINKIKRNTKDKNAVCLIFGDGEWYTINYLSHIENYKYFKDICFLAYYKDKPCREYIQTIKTLKGVFDVEDDHLIQAKTKSIHK